MARPREFDTATLLYQAGELFLRRGFTATSIDEVVITDTIPLTESRRWDKLTVLPIAPMLARAIHEVFEDGSVTSMFGGDA